MYTSYYSIIAASPWTEAAQILFFGLVTSLLIYFFTEWIFQFTGVEKLIHKLLGHGARIGRDTLSRAIGKYIAVFVFLVFLRMAVERTGYTEVEEFLDTLVDYVPFLF